MKNKLLSIGFVLLVVLIFIFGKSILNAAGNSYYVSVNGSDNNNGSQTSPFRTFSKAFSVLTAGDTLYISGGTYTEQLNITKSGITVRAVTGQNVTLDAGYSKDAPLRLDAHISNVTVSDLEVMRGTFDCVLVRGTNINLDNLDVHDCRKFGYRLLGQSIEVANSTCHDSVTENANGTNSSGGWGSCMRTGPGSKAITVRNNHIYNNWGEGLIIGQADGLNAFGNLIHDNYSVNIYIGNALNINVYKNMTYSTNSKYFRSGNPANCISASEEEISPEWGARLSNIKVYNNIAYSCRTGVGYTYKEVSNNGCANCLFAYNTLVNTQGIRVIEGTKNSVTIRNNIISGGAITVPNGTVVSHNLLSDPEFATTPNTQPQSFRLRAGSPAINAGIGVSGIGDDYEGKSRGSTVDIGAIEFSGSGGGTTPPTVTPTSRPTPTQRPTATPRNNPTLTPTIRPTPTTPPEKMGDVNGDGQVNIVDIGIVVDNYGLLPMPDRRADLNDDGKVSIVDVGIVIDWYGL